MFLYFAAIYDVVFQVSEEKGQVLETSVHLVLEEVCDALRRMMAG
jgi:hypothetical protein